MPCFFRLLGLGVVLAPFVLTMLALPQRDWTLTTQSVVTFDANAVVYEDHVNFKMGPFGASMEAFAGDADVFKEDGYLWCSKSGFLPDGQEATLCHILRSVRFCGVASAIMGGVGIVLYLLLGFRSMKLKHVAAAARVGMGVHLLQAVLGFLAVGLWAYLSYAYLDYLRAALGPNFGKFQLPFGRSYYRAIAGAALALLAAWAFHKMGRTSTGLRERMAATERKRAEFEAKEREELARREAEDELKVPEEVV